MGIAARGLASAAGALLLLGAGSAAGSELTILYRFAGGSDGGNPAGPLAMDAQGTLYGIANQGGIGNGIVFSLAPTGASLWNKTVLHSFPAASSVAASPNPGLTLDRSGALYGTTDNGGDSIGSVFRLTRVAAVAAPWRYATLFDFPGGNSAQGGAPYGSLLVDGQGDVFGAAEAGGDVSGAQPCRCGLIYELEQTSAASTESVLHRFGNPPDGGLPAAGLTDGTGGTLFGTTAEGGTGRCLDGSDVYVVGCGTVFSLQRSAGGRWSETILYDFRADEANGPSATLTLGPDGALYGTALLDVFRLAPPANPGGHWRKQVIYEFPGGLGGTAPDTGAVAFDGAGNLYGETRSFGLDGPALLFRLSPPAFSDAPWPETTLFTFPDTHGLANQPQGGVIMGRDNTLYGTVGATPNRGHGYVFAYHP